MKVIIFFCLTICLSLSLSGQSEDSTMLLKAQSFFATDSIEEALILTNALILSEPSNANAYLLRAMCSLKLNLNIRNVLIDLNKAIQLNPDLAEAYAQRGNVYFLLNDLRLARRNYYEAIDREQHVPLYYFNLGNLDARIYHWDEAIIHYSKAIRLHPSYFDAFVERGFANSMSKHFSEALSDYDSALRIQPRNDELFVKRGMVLISLNRNKDAVKMFDRAIRINAMNEDAYYSRGRAYFNMKLFANALNDYDSAILLKPNFEIAWYHRGLCRLELSLSNTQEACIDFKKAAELGFGEALFYLKKYCE